jgi:hypothetical protein
LGSLPTLRAGCSSCWLDHAILDVTPTITGASGNQNYIYAFTVEAQRMRLRVSNEEYWDITHRTTANWIGSKVALTAFLEGQEAFENAGVTVALANVSWTVPTAKAFDNYDPDIGVLDEIFPTDQPIVNFHWRDAIDPATVSVSAQAVVNGTAFALGPSPCHYQVVKPDPAFSATPTGTIQIVNSRLAFGTSTIEGIEFNAAYDPVGEWDVVQLVHSSAILTVTPSGCTLKSGSGVDIRFPYLSRTKTATTLTAWDSPSEPLPTSATRLERTDFFKMWLMFKPADGS